MEFKIPQVHIDYDFYMKKQHFIVHYPKFLAKNFKNYENS